MPKKKEAVEPRKGIEYKGKKFWRKEDKIYYGNPEDKYVVLLTVQESEKIVDVDVSTSVLVELMINAGVKSRAIKSAERDGMYAAMDLAEFWLDEALEEG